MYSARGWLDPAANAEIAEGVRSRGRTHRRGRPAGPDNARPGHRRAAQAPTRGRAGRGNPCGPPRRPHARGVDDGSTLEAEIEMILMQGRQLQLGKRWTLGEQLNKGGFGRVFAASCDDIQAVAKLVPKAPGADRELLFADPGNARNVVPVIDHGETDAAWVLVMPRAERSLREHLIEAAGALEMVDALAVLSDVAAALADLEGRVDHRDLKPENILLLEGHWRLADFGISRYAEATTAPDTRKFSMTPPYAAPEQWRWERAT